MHTTVCVLWSFYQCDIDGVFHRWMAVSISLSVLVVALPTNVLFLILTTGVVDFYATHFDEIIIALIRCTVFRSIVYLHRTASRIPWPSRIWNCDADFIVVVHILYSSSKRVSHFDVRTMLVLAWTLIIAYELPGLLIAADLPVYTLNVLGDDKQ